MVGKVEARSGGINKDLLTGDIEIRANDIRILSEAETPPFQLRRIVRLKRN